jgi:hypothetical protein
MERADLFLNREKEIRFLTDFYIGEVGKSKACVLAGASGIGKTRLTKHAAGRIPATAHVRVAPTRHRGVGSESFYYLRLLADETSQTLSKNDPQKSFRTYRENQREKPLLSAIATDARDIARRLYVPVETLSNLGGRTAKSLRVPTPKSQSVERSELELKIDYLHNALQDQSYLFILENFQDIDLRSYECLLSLLDKNWPHRWLFEFTPGDKLNPGATLILEDLVEDLQARCARMSTYWLERLSADHVAELIAANDNIVGYVLDRYRESDGNLRPLVDLAHGRLSVRARFDIQHNNLGILPLSTITDANIKSLSESERLVLYWIYILGRLATYSLLNDLVTFSPVQFIILDDALRVLSERRLIANTDGIIELAHDRVATSTETIGISDRLFILAKSTIRTNLENGLEKDRAIGSTIDPDVLSTLCVLYSDLGEPARSSLLLDDIARLVAKTGRTDRLVELLRLVERKLEIRAVLPEESRISFFKKLCAIYYAAGFPEDALRACAQLPHSINRALVEAILTDLVYRHEDALHLVNELVLPNTEESDDLFIAAKLTEIAIRRSLNQHEICERELSKLLKSRLIMNHPDYPLVQRASEMVLPFDDAEPLLDSAARSLYSQGRNSEAARTFIISVFVKSVLGKFDEARACAITAERLLTESFNERQCLLNNVAASRMITGLFDEETLELLRRARLTTVPGYDQIVILNNLAIFHAMIGDKAAASIAASYVEKALSKTEVKEKDILRIIYFNLSQFWKDVDETKYDRVLKKSIANQCSYEHGYWEKIWSSKSWNNDQFRGQGVLPFMPTFLSYWTVDLDSLLQRVQ